MALTNLNKLFVRVTNGDLRPQVIEKSKKDNKIYFLTTTQEIICLGVAYGLSTDVQGQIAKIKSILNTYYTDGTKDAVKNAIDAVQNALNTYKAENDAKRALLVKTVTYNTGTKAIDFTSENGTTVQSIKASDIIGNHIIQSSAYDADTNTLKLTFAGADAPVDVNIDLSKMLDMDDVISGNAEHFTVNYNEKKLTITPVITTVNSDTTGLADAKDVKSYVDAAVNGATTDLQGKIDTINGKLDVIQGENTVEGSIKKALKDAKEYADGLNTTATAAINKEVKDRKDADTTLYGEAIPKDGPVNTIKKNNDNIVALTSTLEQEKKNREAADTAEKSAREAAIKEITDALANPATFWEDYTE